MATDWVDRWSEQPWSGKMIRIVQVECGCCTWTKHAVYPYAVNLRRAGWRRTRRYGWLCPDHAARAGEGE